MESKQKTLYMSRQLIEFNHIYKEFNDVYREAATKVGLSLSGFDILYAICEMGGWMFAARYQSDVLYSKADSEFIDP